MLKVIISPAKSIDYKPIQTEKYTTAQFIKEADSLAKKMKKLKVKELEKMMHISSDLAELNVTRYKNWELPVTKSELNFPCIAGFNGEAFKGLDAWSMSESMLNDAQERLRILSGLYGLLKPLDLVYPYRLEMGTKWAISEKAKNLYAFWGTKIAKQLNLELSATDTLVNLASSEYFKAVDLKTLKAKVITPIFKDFKNGEFKTIMMYAKHQRGAMSRYIIENKIEDVEVLKLYTGDGYTFDANASSENEWVFVR